MDRDSIDFDTLLAKALDHIHRDQRAGFPEFVYTRGNYNWLSALVEHDVVKPEVVREVVEALENTKTLDRAHASAHALAILS
jgi:hypothetical protein